jgi:hypothetical protein
MITVIHEQRVVDDPGARAEGEALWLDAEAIHAATGWTWKPEGLCHGDICVPLPPGKQAEVVRDGALDLAAMWRRSGQPLAHDAAGSVWVLGTGAAERSAALASLEAPDFELPDLQGHKHRLSHYRGRKVFLATWASW